ncbi:MAG: alpha/beta fold hydrolase, partial [Candidatus Eisenbacteria bacterium]
MRTPLHLALIAVLALALPTVPAAARAERVAHSRDVEGHWATTDDGIRIWYEVEGDRPGVPIVLIAGGPGSSHNAFHLTHRRLAAFGPLVYLDNRGRGRSRPGRGPRPYSLENDVADVEAVRRALGAEQIIVYGRSYGGMVAQAYALAHPAHVRALVLSNTLDGATAWRNENIAGTHAFLARQFPERWERIEHLHRQGFLTSEDTLGVLFGPLNELYHYDLANDSTFRSRLREVREAEIPGHANEVYVAMIGRDPDWTLDGTLSAVELLPRLGSVTAPALVLAGRYDRICPPAASHRIARALPRGRLVVFERSGHRPELEEADRWFDVMSRFLQEALAL